jgi:hypothetical protein
MLFKQLQIIPVGGDYVTQRNLIRQINAPGLTDVIKSTLEDNYKAFLLN